MFSSPFPGRPQLTEVYSGSRVVAIVVAPRTIFMRESPGRDLDDLPPDVKLF